MASQTAADDELLLAQLGRHPTLPLHCHPKKSLAYFRMQKDVDSAPMDRRFIQYVGKLLPQSLPQPQSQPDEVGQRFLPDTREGSGSAIPTTT